jgi:ParB-like chromosome segregation protein Spo0J
MQPILKQTDNHKMFQLHKLNRNVGNVDPLKRSMKIFGFLPHKAISCIKSGNGKLTITDGNRRFTAASELGIPFW